MIWAGETGAITPIPQEIRPVPDRVAEALGVNLVYTRFAGPAIVDGGNTLAQAAVGDWIFDAKEALAVAVAGSGAWIAGASRTAATMSSYVAPRGKLLAVGAQPQENLEPRRVRYRDFPHHQDIIYP